MKHEKQPLNTGIFSIYCYLLYTTSLGEQKYTIMQMNAKEMFYNCCIMATAPNCKRQLFATVNSPYVGCH